jgi:hypothetical protein
VKKLINVASALVSLLCGSLLPAMAQDGLTIPSGHPRLWWTPARTTQAQAWYATHPFTPYPPGSGFDLNDALQHAFVYVLTGNTTNARNAINALMSYVPPYTLSTYAGSDNSRWNGQQCVLIYDWCHDQMTALERDTIVNRWNAFLDTVRLQTWGGVGMEGNNYYWGNLRNEFEWGVATFGENTQAQKFLDNALTTRWQNSWLPYANGAGRGGVPPEGITYGSEMTECMIVPLASANLMGRNLGGETNFYREFVYYLIYGATPDSTFGAGGIGRVFELLPFNDVEYPDKRDIFGTTANYSYRTYWGNTLAMLSKQYASQPAGQYARRLLNLIHPPVTNIFAAVDSAVPEGDFNALPLDYYAPGMSYLFARNKWGADATSLLFQMGVPKGEGHLHMDAGSFQIWRKGRWVSRETAGYSVSITAPTGRINPSTDVSNTIAHNTLIFDTTGQYSGAPKKGDPVTLRVENNPQYVYAAVDLTESYKVSHWYVGVLPEPPVSSIVREFLFVRPLEALVVLDRLGAGQQACRRQYILHSEQNFTIQDSSHALSVNGSQALRLTVLRPQGQATHVLRIVDEGSGSWCQYRLELETNTADSSYFITILQARDASAGDLTAAMTEDNTSFRITLTNPSQGSAVVVFQKGTASQGGSFAYAVTGTPVSYRNLLGRIQGIQVTDAGPQWENLTSIAEKDQAPPEERGMQLEARSDPYVSATQIMYRISNLESQVPVFVNLSIYNAQGALVTALVNATRPSGDYLVSWNARGLGSGLYFARLSAGGRSLNQRMLHAK